ncbi:MAG TPA: hypothetical protein VF177_03915, partial [Anaerolineae bacterium]
MLCSSGKWQVARDDFTAYLPFDGRRRVSYNAQRSRAIKVIMSKKSLLIILILLVAFALRTYRLTDIPPGLT